MSTPVDVCDTCLDARIMATVDEDPLLSPLLPELLGWLTARRWFAHDTGCLDALLPLQSTVVHDDGQVALLHGLVEAHHAGGAHHQYQLLLGLRRAMPPALAEKPFAQARTGAWEDWYLYDAPEDPELMTELLRYTAITDPHMGPHLQLSVSPSVLRGLTPRLLAVEQSNTSVVYGDELLLKFFRQPVPGPHPELDVLRGLATAGVSAGLGTPQLAGWLHTEGRDLPPMVLGVLTEYLANDGDGWQLAVRQAVDCLTHERQSTLSVAGFTEEAQALGEAVARLHGALREAFGSPRLTALQVLDQVTEMEHRLDEALQVAPDLEPFAQRITSLYDDYAGVVLRGETLRGQRIHGDLHLGQVLRTADGWSVIDFEGEPDRPVAQRGRPQPALRDVAGMLRSFDYAAAQALAQVRAAAGEPDADQDPALKVRQDRRAVAWAVRNRRAFTAGYASAGGADPNCHPVVMRALEADKAVYEVLYEARHRPDWLPIPIAAINRLVTRRAARSRT